MHAAPRDPAFDLLPRTVKRETALGPSAPLPAIIYPANDPVYRTLAETIARVIEEKTGRRSECVADLQLMPERSTPLPAAFRRRPLLALGNLNTNRVLPPLYANYLCSTDAAYPGGHGYDLRTIVNPYGTGTNLVLAGGSSRRGVERAVHRLLDHLADAAQRRTDAKSLTLPFLLEVELEPALAEKLAAWPYTPLVDSAEMQAMRNRGLLFFTEPIRIIGAYTLAWSWTADERYALIARDTLRALNERMQDGYGDWHYLAERFMRAIPLLVAGGFLSDADIRRTDHLLMLTALGNQGEWWRMRHGRPPLGHRHHGKGTYEFLLLARYLRDQANPTPALRAQCETWITECETFLDALAAARIDDQDDESTFNNLAMLYRYALGQERHAFFTSGNARLVAQRAIALHDNNGTGAGQGGYGESQGMYLHQEATIQTAASAFYYGDGELKWILKKLPNLDVAQRYAFLHYTPVFLQKFDTGAELAPVAPSGERGIQCLPVTGHQFALSNHPPIHVEPAGHMVNAPETWQLPEGIGLNHLRQEQGFDKIVLRGGYERRDAYLVIQGYQGGFRWQGHMQAANAIVRFYQAGHVFLVQNTSRHSYHDKNGLLVSDGKNDTPMPPIAERIAIADFANVGLTVTRLSDYHRTEWTRHIFWDKAGDGCFVVIDRVAFQADSTYSLTCSWRTPGYAELQGRRWTSEQGDHRFTLVSSADVTATCEEEFDQGACAPFVLHQRRAGAHRRGDEGSFQNLFYVRRSDDQVALDLRRLDERSALVLRDHQPVAWCGAEVEAATRWLPGVKAKAHSAWATPLLFALAGATSLEIEALGVRMTGASAFSVMLDAAASSLVLRLDSTDAKDARISLTIAGQSRELLLKDAPTTIALPAPKTGSVADTLKQLFGALADASRPTIEASQNSTVSRATAAESSGSNPWQTDWTFDTGTRLPNRVRKVTVTATPLPVDGSPDQLLDPVMPDGYSREIWTQWPKAKEYAFALKFPTAQKVTALNILGDCVDDPSLRTYNPLPETIQVAAVDAAGRTHPRPVKRTDDRRYKRYRDAENRLEAWTSPIAESVQALQVRIGAPANDQPFVLHRFEILGDRPTAPEIQHWTSGDIDGDGQSEIAIVNAVNELIVLNAQGRERWRKKLAVPVTHISCQPLERGKPIALCVGLLGGELQVFHADGTARHVRPLAEEFRQQKDCLFGWFNAIHCLAIWHRGADGRGSLVIGGYGIVVFLDADLRIVGHAFSDGPWNYNILVVPESRPDRGDIYVRCGWNHGIQYYKGVEGPGPSGVKHSFGGFQQPMFRKLERVIPFLNGRSLAYSWVDLPSLPEGALFAATELGCGVLSTAQKDWRWKLEGGMSLNTCVLGRLDATPVALTGGQDGFVTAVDLASGAVIRSLYAGSAVVGLNQDAHGTLLVATRQSVQCYDAKWMLQSAIPKDIVRATASTDRGLLVIRNDQTLEHLHFG